MGWVRPLVQLALLAPALAGGDDDRTLAPELEERLAHWAWQQLAPPTLPDAGRDWALDPLDRFVHARLAQAGLAPAPDAERAVWLRRVHLDLTGLPPTPDEVLAFLADGRIDAYERIVDRLLASPRHAERLARHWLDLVRYAETKGHEFDYRIPNAFEYRDHVVRAFARDVPYDRLLVEHVAGDLLADPRRDEHGANESVLGTGFWVLGTELHSPVDLAADRAARTADRIDVFSRAFLGLTVACARCHDHKADAIAQHDYYALAGIVESSRERQVRFESDGANRALAAELHALEREHEGPLRRALAADLAAAARAVEELLAGPLVLPDPSLPPWLAPGAWLLRAASLAPQDDPLRVVAAALARLDLPAQDLPAPVQGARTLFDAHGRLADPSTEPWIVDGPAFGPAPVPAGALRWRGGRVVGVEPHAAARHDVLFDRLERDPLSELHEAGLTWDGAGRTLHTRSFELHGGRLFVLLRGGAHVHAGIEGHRLVHGPLHGAGKRTWPAGEELAWRELDLRDYAGRVVHLEFTPTGGEDLALVQVVELDAPPAAPARRTRSVDAGELERAALALADPTNLTPRDARLLAWLLRWPLLGPTVPARSEPLRAAYLARRAELEARLRTRSRLAPALIDGSGRDAPLLDRGDPNAPRAAVPRSFLAALDGGALAVPGSGRLELALRLVDGSNPLPARVWVNRLWHHLFGRGLVASVDDLGAMGEAPTHPELLDHLAARLVESGWSTRALLRELCLSRTYRMASRATARGEELDPKNLLWHRANLRRLDAETLRDSILAFSGGLDPTPGGPSVPLHLTPFLEGRGRPGVSGPLDGAGRRSLYQAVRRNFPQPLLAVFDQPTPATTRGRRDVSNVPAQTLALLNDDFVLGECERLARSLVADARPRRELLAELVLRAYARPAAAVELERLESFLDAHGGDPRAAWSDLVQALVLAREFRYLP